MAQVKEVRKGIEICQYDMCGNLVNEFPSMVEAGWYMHMSPNVFSRRLKKTREFGGFRWGLKSEMIKQEIEDKKIRNMFPMTIELFEDHGDSIGTLNLPFVILNIVDMDDKHVTLNWQWECDEMCDEYKEMFGEHLPPMLLNKSFFEDTKGYDGIEGKLSMYFTNQFENILAENPTQKVIDFLEHKVGEMLDEWEPDFNEDWCDEDDDWCDEEPVNVCDFRFIELDDEVYQVKMISKTGQDDIIYFLISDDFEAGAFVTWFKKIDVVRHLCRHTETEFNLEKIKSILTSRLVSMKS